MCEFTVSGQVVKGSASLPLDLPAVDTGLAEAICHWHVDFSVNFGFFYTYLTGLTQNNGNNLEET